MSIRQQIAQYKAEFEGALARRDATAAIAAAIAYAGLLRGMAIPPVSYMERAWLKGIADRYERAATLIKGAGKGLDAATVAAVCQIVETGAVAAKPAPAPAPTPAAPAPKKPAVPKKPTATPPPAAPKAPTATAPKPTAPPAAKKPTPPTADDPMTRLFRGLSGPTLADLGVGTAAPTPAPSPAPPPAASAPVTPPPAQPRHVFEGTEWSADVFERYRTATVIIRVDDAVATGFFFREDGYILTNHHVAYMDDGTRSTRFRIENGDKSICGEAEFIKADKGRDVALLRLKNGPAKVPFIPLEDDYSRIRPGMEITIIGNGLNFGLAPINGTIKFTERKGNIVYTAPTNSGDSGSPVISRDGRCVGIHKSATVDAKGLSNGTPVPDILELLDIWLKDK